MQATYTNRYKDKIIFEQNGDEITMTGYNPEWIRVGYANKENGETDWDKVYMVDPSGGPYIALGTNLGMFYGDNVERIVEGISINELSVIFKIKT